MNITVPIDRWLYDTNSSSKFYKFENIQIDDEDSSEFISVYFLSKDLT